MTPDACQHRLEELATDSYSLDIRPFESSGTPDLMAGLVPRALAVMQKGADLFSAILAIYEPEVKADGQGGDLAEWSDFESSSDQPGEQTFGQQLDSLVDGEDAVGDPRQHLTDVAFMARWELRQRLDAIRASSAREEAWEIISRCSSGLRRVRKTAAAIERALCDVEGLKPVLLYQTELSIALDVRRCYGRFVRELLECCPVDEDNVERALRSASSSIAKLIGRDDYPEFRITDRIHIRQLQQRVLDWARQKGDARTGFRLWQDINAFASLLGQISQRQELVAHDRQLAEEAWSALIETGRRDAFITDADVVPFRSLEGLDPSLDTLLCSPKGTLAVEWMPPLMRLRKRLSGVRDNAGDRAGPPVNLFEAARPQLTEH